MKLILASASPRRKEILLNHGIEALIMPSDADETLPEGLGMTEAVEELARRKASACLSRITGSGSFSGYGIIAADTIVWKNGIMGKPADKEDAFRMLSAIRGTWHYVATGLALADVSSGNITVMSEVTRVFCTSYTDDDILDYLATDEPYDKAGSYAIQGIFGRYIDHIEGDYENVVGLPYCRLEPLITPYI